jgi:hypothetical protein
VQHHRRGIFFSSFSPAANRKLITILLKVDEIDQTRDFSRTQGAKNMKKWMSLIAAMLLVSVLAACGGAAPAGGGTTAGAGPEAVAKTFIEASFTANLEAARSVACAALTATLTDETAASMQEMMSEANPDFSALTYTVSDQTDTSATVTVGGTLKMTVAGVTQDMNFADMGPAAILPIVKEGDAWKVCPAS